MTVRAGAQFAVKWFLLLFQKKIDNLTIPKAQAFEVLKEYLGT